MGNSYLDDVIILLIELCEPLDDTETMDLMDVSISMAQNEEFKKHYTAAVKSIYLRYFQDLKNKTYHPQKFLMINRKIITAIKDKVANAEKLPIYTQTNHNTNPSALNELRNKIANLRKK